MSRLLRPACAWLALFSLVFGNLLPLGALAATPSALDICTSSGNPASTPASPGHLHCLHCGACQPVSLDFPKDNIAIFRATLAYDVRPQATRTTFPARMAGNSWARAPPL